MKKVLIVDDAATDVKNLQKILVEAGWLVSTASSGTAGLEKARSDPPDFILMDVNMPDLDGFSATRKLSQDPVTAGIPVIFVTSKGQKADRVFAQMLGAKGFITKPYTAVQILAQLEPT